MTNKNNNDFGAFVFTDIGATLPNFFMQIHKNVRLTQSCTKLLILMNYMLESSELIFDLLYQQFLTVEI